MKQYLIIADDFTGAIDSGVQLARHGIDVEVRLFPEETHSSNRSLVLDTETKNLPATEAAARVREMTGAVLAENSYDLLYKKIDSTLRGNIPEELMALRAVSGHQKIVFCPAFPKIGRTTVDGIHYLNNTRLSATEFARDPEKPVSVDRLQELLAPLGPVRHHALDEIRSGKICLDGERVHTFDAVTTSDLMQIAALVNTGSDILWVGSSGLANAIFDRLFKTPPVLCVAASLSEVSLAQINHAEQSGTRILRIPTEDILQEANRSAAADKIRDCLDRGYDVILTAARQREDYERTIASARSLYAVTAQETTRKVSRHLAAVAREVLETQEVAGIVLTGGDTSISVIRALGASGSVIRREVLTAIVLSELSGGPFEGLKMITKAGAFGRPEDLQYCIKKIRETTE